MIKNIVIKNKITLFILFNIFYAILYLYSKHEVSNDSSISEWLINYQGGFTRRGLGGEINIFFAKVFNISLRQSIFVLQSVLHTFYLLFLLNFIKKINFNIAQIFALFTPIFILYPIAELEVLGRKEMLLFLFFITSIFLMDKRYSPNFLNIYILIFFPLACLVWEQIVLFAPYFIILVIFKNNLETFRKTFFKVLIIFGPSILTFLIIFLFPLSKLGHQNMCNYLLIEFNEKCYMSADLLIKNTIYFDTFSVVHGKASFQHYFRYLLIILIGFFPLNFLLFKNSFKYKDNFITKNFKLYSIFLILYSPSILLFLFGYDWGRWVNITYTFSILLYFYLLKNELITNDFIMNNIFSRLLNNKRSFLIIFIIFAFGWNQKTVLTGDVATNSLYKIVYNSTKIIFNYDGLRILQDNPIIKFHRNYIE